MINNVGELKSLLEYYYDGQPISVIVDDTGEVFQLIDIDVNEESEVELIIQ